MTNPTQILNPERQKIFPALASLVIPGLGQLFERRRWRSLVIFLAAAVSIFLVNWGLTEYKIGKVGGENFFTTWLWLPLALFWIWNVWDAYALSNGKAINTFPAIVIVGVIIYVLAWNVTNVKLDRLVTRFDSAQKILKLLINPELAKYREGGVDKACSWGCLAEYFGDKLAGRDPRINVQVSSDLLDIFGRVEMKAAPAWMENLGLAQDGQEVSTYIAGKMVETIAIGLLATIFSTILAFPLSFLAAHNIMSKIPGGQPIYYVMRTILNIVRAIDTVVWGLLVIVWVGLGSFAGVIALTIHSIAALGKLYSEEIEHIDTGPVEALTSTGANLFQTIRYGVIPQITPSFLAYTLLRWDINMRSATVIGFVAGGGIGFFVVETIRAGAFQLYAAALWVTAVVIIIVDFVSSKMRENILRDRPRKEISSKGQKIWFYVRNSLFGVIGIGFFVYFWQVCQIDLPDLFHPAPNFFRMVGDFLKMDFSPDLLSSVVQQMLITIFQALLATTLGAIVALPFSFLAAKNLTGKSPIMAWIYYLTRSLFNILRSIEALLYVAIFVAWVGIGPFAGMLALAITTFALLGKLFSEAIENIEDGPIEAVTTTGANTFQVISFAILPQIVPAFVSYLIYQWDINIRMATIIGFAGGGGIGLTLSTFFGSLQYHKAGTVVLFIVVVVALMDFTSAKLREIFDLKLGNNVTSTACYVLWRRLCK